MPLHMFNVEASASGPFCIVPTNTFAAFFMWVSRRSKENGFCHFFFSSVYSLFKCSKNDVQPFYSNHKFIYRVICYKIRRWHRKNTDKYLDVLLYFSSCLSTDLYVLKHIAQKKRRENGKRRKKRNYRSIWQKSILLENRIRINK